MYVNVILDIRPLSQGARSYRRFLISCLEMFSVATLRSTYYKEVGNDW